MTAPSLSCRHVYNCCWELLWLFSGVAISAAAALSWRYPFYVRRRLPADQTGASCDTALSVCIACGLPSWCLFEGCCDRITRAVACRVLAGKVVQNTWGWGLGAKRDVMAFSLWTVQWRWHRGYGVACDVSSAAVAVACCCRGCQS
jgi:hypothetical protein